MPGWFKKREVSTFVHPVLGTLELRPAGWSGDYDFGAEKFSVHILVGDQDGRPVKGAAKFIQEFEQRYQTLSSPMAGELRQLYEPWYEEFWNNPEPLPTSDALLAMFELTAIDFFDNGVPVVEFALKKDWDDGRFRISLEDWTPKGPGVED